MKLGEVLSQKTRNARQAEDELHQTLAQLVFDWIVKRCHVAAEDARCSCAIDTEELVTHVNSSTKYRIETWDARRILHKLIPILEEQKITASMEVGPNIFCGPPYLCILWMQSDDLQVRIKD